MDFDPDFYLNYYKDLKLAGIKTDKEALNHYINYGKKEGRYANSKQLIPSINKNNFNLFDFKKELEDIIINNVNNVNNINDIILITDLI